MNRDHEIDQKSKLSLIKEFGRWRQSRAQSKSALLVRLRRDSATDKLDAIFRIIASDPNTPVSQWTDEDTALTSRIRIAIEERGEVDPVDLQAITELYTRIAVDFPAGRKHEYYRIKNRALLDLFNGARRLASFAVQGGRLPQNVNIGDFTRLRQDFDEQEKIGVADVKKLAANYQELEAALGPITAESLQATARPVDEQDVSIRRHRVRALSPAGAYLQRVRRRTYWVLVLLALLHVVDYIDGAGLTWSGGQTLSQSTTAIMQFLTVLLTPWFYGALGASVFILKATSQEVRDRVFHVRNIPANRSRFWLGTIAGGMIVLFTQEMTTTGQPQSISILDQTSFAALGFLAGYSTSFFFNILDAMLGALGIRQQSPQEKSVVRIVEVEAERGREGPRTADTRPESAETDQPKPVETAGAMAGAAKQSH